MLTGKSARFITHDIICNNSTSFKEVYNPGTIDGIIVEKYRGLYKVNEVEPAATIDYYIVDIGGAYKHIPCHDLSIVFP